MSHTNNTDWHILATCKAKQVFASADLAAKVAKRMSTRRSVNISSYRCPHCEAWHLGTVW